MLGRSWILASRPRPRALCLAAVIWAAIGCAPAGPSVSPPPGAEASGASNRSKWIIAAFLSDPPGLVPRVNVAVTGGRQSFGTIELPNVINTGLTIAQDGGVLHPRLAEAVPSVENGLWRISPDGRTETSWTIKEGVVWHDAAPFTTADLAFSARVARDRELPLIRDVGYDLVEEVVVLDSRTVTVKWKEPYINAPLLFGGAFLVPKHLLEGPYLEDKANFVYHPYWTTQFVGLGPFKVREFVRGTHLILEANERYILGRPKLDGIEVRFFLDANTLAANILAGAVELTIGTSFAVEPALRLAEQWRDGRLEMSADSADNPIHIFPQFINPNPAVILDVRFRRALYHAINRRELADSAMGGKGVLADGILWDPSNPEWNDIERSIVRYPFDPRRATQLLEDIGYRKRADSAFHDPTSDQRLTVELRTLTSFDTPVKIIFPVADYWQRVGVGVDTVIVPQQLQGDRKYRAERPGFDMPVSPRNLTRHHSAEVALPENDYRGANRARYGNPDFDTLIDRYYVTIPWSDRMAVLARIVHHMTDQVTVMGLFFDMSPVMVSNRILNVKAWRGSDLWNPHEWDVK